MYKIKRFGFCKPSGCIEKHGDVYRIRSNTRGTLWKQKYKTRESAEKSLAAYHANRG